MTCAELLAPTRCGQRCCQSSQLALRPSSNRQAVALARRPGTQVHGCGVGGSVLDSSVEDHRHLDDVVRVWAYGLLGSVFVVSNSLRLRGFRSTAS